MYALVKSRIAAMARDDSGAALVTTIAVFMFMYLMGIGIYALGTNVKERIHLQNACDAAAYSAAVVQADTLSRMAAINRALSWTYVQMTRRQMDYIEDRWLGHTLEHYDTDRAAAFAWWLGGTHCPLHGGWHASNIDLNGTHTVSRSAIASARDGFGRHLRTRAASFFGAAATRDGLGRQIAEDKNAIRAMNAALVRLASDLPRREEAAASQALAANIPEHMRAHCKFMVERCENPLGQSGFFTTLSNTADNESRFLWFGGWWGGKAQIRKTSSAAGAVAGGAGRSVFGSAADVWFRLGDKMRYNAAAAGIQRSYRMLEKAKLYSRWTWWSLKTVCHGVDHFPGIPYRTCLHPCPDDRCQSIGGHQMRATVYANILRLWNGNYEGEPCRPLVLTRDYFGRQGTITVGIACANKNPFSWFGNVSKGIYSAFNPFVSKTVCFSSAKAGYKNAGEDVADTARAYRVDWRNGHWSGAGASWNLCQSDWDAVFVPVRRAQATAQDSAWGAAGRPLEGWLEKLDVAQSVFRAGDGARARWNVGSPASRIDWTKLQDRMFH